MDDLEFVQRCVKGDKQAWDEFVDKYSRLIYNYIHSVLRVKGLAIGQENIDDLFQEIFLSLVKDNFKKLNSFRGQNNSSLASWLRQVVINHTIDYVRKFKPVVSLDEEDDDDFSLKDLLSDGSVHTAEALISEEKMGNLKECIGKLERDDQYFLELYINRGVTLEELKVHFRVNRGAIDMRKSRIIERLKDCFKDKGFLLD